MDDGAELVMKAPAEAPVTAVISEADKVAPETIEAPAPVVSSEPAPPATVAATPTAKNSLMPVLIIVPVLLIVGLMILVLWAVVPSGEGIVPFFVTRLARRLPMVLLALGGIAFAVVRWRRHPRASLITALALAIYLFDMVVYTLVLYWLPTVVDPMNLSPSASRWFYSVVYFIEDIVIAVTIILLVAAAFADRKSNNEIKE